MLFDTHLQNIFLPNVYFLFILILLLLLFFLITFQLWKIIIREISFYFLNKKRQTEYSIDELFILLKILINKKLWFQSIKLMEANKNIQVKNMHRYCNFIGLIYYNMKQYGLAQAYYLKAINLKKDYVIALQNLAKLYDKQKQYDLAVSIYKSILIYDKYNVVASQYLQRKKL